ncbi:hypothetical protein AMATHDRAFT_200517 [Amanita thiersii Skay4041]|uniref:Protein-S-isoprenylcysteine O-methyltransferase n=1 Tax=Amanita thiersii Skay4041 TaxID=703135 RepID=A0A2A9N7M9_9AGAR|nr:hypothetical protein AMATHDRAFT_200517 [Amanita thiersii Skay4041]
MSLARALVVTIQAVCNHLACTPPNPTPQKGRYHTDEPWILQIAPSIFKCHLIILWMCAGFECLLYISTLYPALPPSLSPFTPLLCPATFISTPQPPNLHLTALAFIGFLAVLLGTYIRLDCFRTLGHLFTFDLTIHPQHKLITARFYGYVRHPAYTGSLLLVAGIAFSHLTHGGWLTECGPLRPRGTAGILWGVWWIWTLAVGVSRAYAEDRQMRKLFQDEWDAYAANVPWWFFPGIL